MQIEVPGGQTIPSLSMDAINQAAAAQQIQGIQGVQPQTVETELTVEQCPTGTYSSAQQIGDIVTQVCVHCPAGTASTTAGASDPSACVLCPTGSYAAMGASTCTKCPANTFSVTPQAADASTCIACPANTTSLAGADAVEKCICNPTFFPSYNILSAQNNLNYDTTATTLSFAGALPINFAHVSCSL